MPTVWEVKVEWKHNSPSALSSQTSCTLACGAVGGVSGTACDLILGAVGVGCGRGGAETAGRRVASALASASPRYQWWETQGAVVARSRQLTGVGWMEWTLTSDIMLIQAEEVEMEENVSDGERR